MTTVVNEQIYKLITGQDMPSGMTSMPLGQAALNAAVIRSNSADTAPQWVFAGVPCVDAKDFANHMWPQDCQEKTWFLLKYNGLNANSSEA